MRDIIIHHLTDIHVGPLHYQEARNLPLLESQLPNSTNFDHYIEFLNTISLQMSDLNPPDLIIISGDLTSFGSESEFDLISAKLRKIEDYLNQHPSELIDSGPRLLVVPGNQDLDWSKIAYRDKISRYSKLCAQFPNVLFSPISGNKQGGSVDYYDYGDKSNLLILLIDSCELGGTDDPIIKSTSKIIEEYKSIFRNVDVDQNKLDLAVSNLRNISKKDPGFININTLNKNLSRLPIGHEKRFKIAVMHHNPVGMPNGDIESFDTIINAGLVKGKLANKGFDLILHGHRHFKNCIYEEINMEGRNLNIDFRHGSPYQQGMYILGGGTLGSEKQGWFYEMSISEIERVHDDNPPSSIVEVISAKKNDVTGYNVSNAYRLIVDKPTTANIRLIQEQLNRVPSMNTELLREVLNKISPSIRKLQAEIDGYNEDDSRWLEVFHSYIDEYCRIYATDYLGPRTWMSPQYISHVITQFSHRLRRLLMKKDPELSFSPLLFRAIKNTGWDPNQYLQDYMNMITLKETESIDSQNLEIVRIVFWDSSELNELPLLKMIDRLHGTFLVPIFVVPKAELEPLEKHQIKEFLIGFSETGHQAFGLIGSNKTPRALGRDEYNASVELFENLLKSDKIKSLQSIIA